MSKENQVINSLLDLPTFEPEERTVYLPRLKLELVLRELPYDKLVKLSQERDPNVAMILACIVNHPELYDHRWYEEKMGKPSTAEAFTSLLRKGEIHQLSRVLDRLHGFTVGSVVEMQDQAVSKAVGELKKNGKSAQS